MSRLLQPRRIIVTLGVLMVLGSLALELRPGSEGGIGPLQILIIVGGVLLILFATVRISPRLLVTSLMVSPLLLD